MRGPSIRSLCLALAVWAVLFAPGAYRGDTGPTDVAEDANRLAAAVIAPTFSADGIHAARPCRAGTVQADVCDTLAGLVPAATGMVLAAAVSSVVASRRLIPQRIRQQRATPSRAPPRD